jgi:hypothetical protein
MGEGLTKSREETLDLSQELKSIIITSHAIQRFEQRGIILRRLIKWLKSKETISVYISKNMIEIPIPSRKRLVGNIYGNEIIITTALYQYYQSKLDPNTLEKTKIRISKNITLGEKPPPRIKKYRYPEIINDLISDDSIKRKDARKKVIKIGTTIVPDLKNAYYKEEDSVKWKVVQALGTVGTSYIIPFLENLTNSDNKKIRLLAQRSIKQIKARSE